MGDFVGTEPSKLDAKGRCIVPAGFRKVLQGEALYLRPSVRGPFLEGWPASAVNGDAAPRLGPTDVIAPDDDDQLYALIAAAVPVNPDADGRVILPGELIAHAGLGSEIVFVGRRSFLEVWSKPAFDARMRQAMAAMAERQRAALAAKTAGGAAA
jgi:MraZ protein